MKLVIDIQVSNLERAVTFYTETLGLACRIQKENWAGITIGDAEIHLYTNGGVIDNVEFYVDDIDTTVKALKEKGVTIIPGNDKPEAIGVKNDITEFPWGRTAFFKDSEGNKLAFVQDY